MDISYQRVSSGGCPLNGGGTIPLPAGQRKPRASYLDYTAADSRLIIAAGEPLMKPTEIVFEVTEAGESGYDARALGYSIFTQGENWADPKA